jgi:hypothetical protein
MYSLDRVSVGRISGGRADVHASARNFTRPHGIPEDDLTPAVRVIE